MPNSLNNSPADKNADAILVLEDGTVFKGKGVGAKTTSIGEICFNTSMTGYQEILSDPSYAGQMINFTFPHIGNTGTNDEDVESKTPHARGIITNQPITDEESWRANAHLNKWLKQHNIPGICGINTRALTEIIRDKGAPKGVLCHGNESEFDIEAMQKQAIDWHGLEGLDLAKDVTCDTPYEWNQKEWSFEKGYTEQQNAIFHVVAIDFGAKQNILRCLASHGCRVSVVPAKTSAENILCLEPDGIFLSNGPGDPAATGRYAVPTVKALMERNLPIFGICLGHQILALALGGKTEKMHLGHRGANHPVKDLQTGKVEITSQNHGFEVLTSTLPENVEPTHVSLFDGTNEGLRVSGKPVFSVQYHPEASPGPHDSHYLFERFVENIRKSKNI